MAKFVIPDGYNLKKDVDLIGDLSRDVLSSINKHIDDDFLSKYPLDIQQFEAKESGMVLMLGPVRFEEAEATEVFRVKVIQKYKFEINDIETIEDEIFTDLVLEEFKKSYYKDLDTDRLLWWEKEYGGCF